MKELAKALLKVHQEMPNVGNNAVNGHFRSDYATLDHIIDLVKPVFLKHGIIVKEGCREGAVSIQLLHAESAEIDDLCIIDLVCKDPSNPQQQKSAETYARRRLWQLKAGICPAGEDDDANNASQETSKAQPAQDPLALLKPHETAIIAFAASKGTFIAGLDELPSSWLRDPQKLIATANEYAAKNTVTKEVAK
jgi:hypothetical protein